MFRRTAAAAVLAAGLFMAAGAARAVQPLEAYGALPYIETSQFKLSASGARIAFVARNPDGTRQLIVRELSGATLTSANITTNKVRGLRWAGDDYVLLTTSSTLNNLDSSRSAVAEFAQVVVINVKTGASFAVFSHDKSIYPSVFGLYGVAQKDGRWVGYFGGVTLQGMGNGFVDFAQGGQRHMPDHAYTDLYEVELETAKATKVLGGSEKIDAWAMGSDGVVVAHSEYDQATGKWRAVAGTGAGQPLLTLVSPTHDTALVGVGRKPGTVLIASSDAGQPALAEYDLATGEPTPLLAEYAIDAELRDQNNTLVGAKVAGERSKSLFVDPAIQAGWEKASKPFKAETVNYVSASADWKKWLLFTEGDGDSGTYWMVDLTTHKAEAVATTYPSIEPGDVGPTRMVSYAAADGTALKGVLTLPPGKEPKGLPVVVMPHGGPQAHDSLRFDWLAQAFASRGYAVFQPNFRGSDGGTVDFIKAGYGEWGRKMQTDVSDGLAELVKQGIVDPKRACIVGASYGGYAALAGVTIQTGLYRCAVSYAGLSDLKIILRDSGDSNETIRTWKVFFGARGAGDPVVRQVSPLYQAERADAPILLIHGKDDTVVDITQSKLMLNALNGAHKPVEYVEIVGADHWLSTEAARIQVLKAAVEFVQKNNPS